MLVPQELQEKYPIVNDVDTFAIISLFREAPGSRVLEVGCHDAPTSMILAEMGYQVVGVDLRTPNTPIQHPNMVYCRWDFCDLPTEFLTRFRGTFDAVVAVSVLEHMGLSTYNEGRPHSLYDVIAARIIWEMLKPGGTAYISVPASRHFWTNGPHWRAYDERALYERIIQDFYVEHLVYVVSGAGIFHEGRELKVGSILTREIVKSQKNWKSPHVSAIMKLRKVGFSRLSPDGR